MRLISGEKVSLYLSGRKPKKLQGQKEKDRRVGSHSTLRDSKLFM